MYGALEVEEKEWVGKEHWNIKSEPSPGEMQVPWAFLEPRTTIACETYPQWHIPLEIRRFILSRNPSTNTMAKKKGAQSAQPAADPPGSSLIICRNKYVRAPSRQSACCRMERRVLIVAIQTLALHLLLPRTMAPATARDPRLPRPPELHHARPAPG